MPTLTTQRLPQRTHRRHVPAVGLTIRADCDFRAGCSQQRVDEEKVSLLGGASSAVIGIRNSKCLSQNLSWCHEAIVHPWW